jgi:ABC-type amino acid transport substrate-binding protein
MQIFNSFDYISGRKIYILKPFFKALTEYLIDLLKLLSERIDDFDYEIFLSAGNKYGAKQPDGSWDGMIGYLLSGEADVAVAPLTINQVK